MAAKCINKNTPKFTSLSEQTGISKTILAAKISVWMERNESEEIPTAEQLGISIDNIKKPFAVFVVGKMKDGNIAATTRASDRGEAGKIGLPGGKVDPGESAEEAAIREAKEEGWNVKKINKELRRSYIEGQPVFWYEVDISEEPLSEFKEMGRISPIKTSQSEISESGYGNEFIKDMIFTSDIKPRYYLAPNTVVKTSTIFNPKEYKKEYNNVELPFVFEKNLQNALEDLNANSKGVNIVGGAVRDALQGVNPKDIDFEVFGISKDELKNILSKHGEVREQGEAFGVIVLKTENDEYEFALPRKDNKTGVGYTGFEVELNPDFSIEEASKRRDFTWNSMSYNPVTKTIYDPNNGLKDLQDGIIRHVDAKTFSEDPLRIMRAMQFQARMGHRIAGETKTLMKDIISRGEMSSLSPARFVSEWRKWALKGKHHSLLFDFLRETGLEEFFPEFKKLKTTKQDTVYHPEGDVEEHTMQVLAKAKEIADRENLDDTQKEILIFSALLHDIAKPETTQEEWSEKLGRNKISARGHEAAGVQPAEEFLKKIGTSTKEVINIVKPLIREHLAHATISSIDNEKGKRSAFAKLVDRLKPATVEQLMLLMEADMMGRNNSNSATPLTIQEFGRLLEEYKQSNKGDIGFKSILGGRHIERYGLKQGPIFGDILRAAKEAQLNIEFENEPEAIEWLGKYMAEGNIVPQKKAREITDQLLIEVKGLPPITPIC